MSSEQITPESTRDLLRKLAAGKEDMLALQLLDIDEQLPESQGRVIRSFVAFKLKDGVLREFGCGAMAEAAQEAMQSTLILSLLLGETKEEK